jgi:NAD(P)-dependent dehydrogenase (short-subunit alcohol dehydrogenase family)
MTVPLKTAIVTGASQGIGAGIVKVFVERGFNVVANSRKVTQSNEVAASDHVALVDGHIGEPATAASIVEAALSRFRSIDVLVNNAGIFFTKPFTDYTAENFRSLVSTNVEGFLYVTSTFHQADAGAEDRREHNYDHGGPCPQPDPGRHGGGADDHKRRSGNDHPAPCDGVRERQHPRERGRARRRLHTASSRNPEGSNGEPVADGSAFDGEEITDAVMYLTDAATVTGHILYVDGGSHFGHW